jgi:hypothetical protein
VKRKLLAVATAVAVALGTIGAATAASDIETLDAVIIPTKLDKRKLTPARVFADIFIASNDESSAKGEQPPTAERIRLDLPRNLRFDAAAVPRCKVGAGQLRGKSAAQQEQLCGRASKVSVDNGSSAEITWDATPLLPSGDSIVTEAALQVFNGREKDTIYLATDPDGMMEGPVISGRVERSDAGPGYGRQFDLSVPSPTLGAFSDLKLTIHQGGFVRARCRSRTNKFLVRTQYADHSPTTAVDATACKRKKR